MVINDRSTSKDEKLEEIVLTRLLRLNSRLSGLVTGLSVGIGVFISTNWLVIKGGSLVGPHLSLLGQFFIGYRVTFVGSLIGFAYGFGCAFIAGILFARIYNWFAQMREEKR